ncbi:AMP-binding protein [Solibacillus sp. FSL H8-0538]|uniref:AMP-binding protein n=1 Tax=Solibacillus sp. FSL H8-0538 TaxID=2921400 RepID=UPI0030FACC42
MVFENSQWTYRKLYNYAKKVANYFTRQGYQKGEIVAQYTLNSDVFMAIYYGVQLAGLTVMPINTKLAPPEVAHCNFEQLFCGLADIHSNYADIHPILADKSQIFADKTSRHKNITNHIL